MNARAFTTLMLSCPERHETRAATLASLKAGGWPVAPEVVLDEAEGPTSMARFNAAWLRLLGRAGTSTTEFVLLLEDDLIFGHWFAENLASWPVMRANAGAVFFGSLYNHGHAQLTSAGERQWQADPVFSWGSQALVLTPLTARFLVANWEAVPGNADIRMPRLAGAITPIYYHRPSLVQHAPGPSTWGAVQHSAADFDPLWRA